MGFLGRCGSEGKREKEKFRERMSLFKMMYYVGGATVGGYILLKLVERDPESVRKVRPRLVLFFSFSSVFGLMCLAWVYACEYMFLTSFHSTSLIQLVMLFLTFFFIIFFLTRLCDSSSL